MYKYLHLQCISKQKSSNHATLMCPYSFHMPIPSRFTHTHPRHLQRQERTANEYIISRVRATSMLALPSPRQPHLAAPD
jgi:hypothetical protein